MMFFLQRMDFTEYLYARGEQLGMLVELGENLGDIKIGEIVDRVPINNFTNGSRRILSL